MGLLNCVLLSKLGDYSCRLDIILPCNQRYVFYNAKRILLILVCMYVDLVVRQYIQGIGSRTPLRYQNLTMFKSLI